MTTFESFLFKQQVSNNLAIMGTDERLNRSFLDNELIHVFDKVQPEVWIELECKEIPCINE